MSTVVRGKRPDTDDLTLPQIGWDMRSLRVGLMLLALAILNGFDLAYSLFAHRISQLNEMNPVMAALLSFGPMPFITFKVLLVISGLSLLWKFRYCRLTIPACWVLFTAYASLGLVWVQWVHTVNSTFELRLSSAIP
jgi:hypothetical protein